MYIIQTDLMSGKVAIDLWREKRPDSISRVVGEYEKDEVFGVIAKLKKQGHKEIEIDKEA